LLLKVESVPVGCPVIFDELPDVDGFYREWLCREVGGEIELCKGSLQAISEWAAGLTKWPREE